MMITPRLLVRATLLICFVFVLVIPVRSQDNYEIQVYGSETVPKNNLMTELHSNFISSGQVGVENGVLPSQHVLHETLELTYGFTSFFETGLYFFNEIGNEHRTTYVGSHIRPRFMVPKEWNWPVGFSLSMEFGYQKREYSEDDWNLEIRPIIDKKIGKFYSSVNLTFDKSIHGLNQSKGLDFAPSAKVSFDVTKSITPGLEYYSTLGPISHILPYPSQEQQLFFVVDLDWSPYWEFNAGYGLGLTSSTDGGIFKIILGYRFH